jgi:hypothetical protein
VGGFEPCKRIYLILEVRITLLADPHSARRVPTAPDGELRRNGHFASPPVGRAGTTKKMTGVLIFCVWAV